MDIQVYNPSSGGGTNYWARTGTILSPATSGDTVEAGDGTASQVSYAFESDATSGLGWLDDGTGNFFPTLVGMTTKVLSYGSAAAVWNIDQVGYQHRWWSPTLGAGSSDAGAFVIQSSNRVGVGIATTFNAARFNVQNAETETDSVTYFIRSKGALTGTPATDFRFVSSLGATSGTVTLADPLMDHSVTLVEGGGATFATPVPVHRITVTASVGVDLTDFRFQSFLKGGTEVWDVHHTGASRNRYAWTATVVAGVGAPDAYTVTFAEALPSTSYGIGEVGQRAAYTAFNGMKIAVGTGWVHQIPVIDESTKATTGFTGYVSYIAYDGITLAQIASSNSIGALNTAILAFYASAGGLVSYADTDLTVVNGLLRLQY